MQASEGFVDDQELYSTYERTGQRNPALLAAGELSWATRRQFFGQPHHFERFSCADSCCGRGQFRDQSTHWEYRIERGPGVLSDVGEMTSAEAAKRVVRKLQYVFTGDSDVTGVLRAGG